MLPFPLVGSGNRRARRANRDGVIFVVTFRWLNRQH
jgi:hypothetical protein